MHIIRTSLIDYYKIYGWRFLIMKTEKQSLRQRMANASELPKDVVLGMPVLTMMGQLEMSIENYRGIIEYTNSLVRIQTKIGQIRVVGKRLQVDYYTNDDMKITGRIESIEYQN